ncbi:27778_t:CDS:10 [Racocetra persica]|uniref:27778_t:CDS:1 n=1 Tax=Racocetra persica TaxID=160502 RepID=A0ACA9L4Y6_9GLOM|nr:27778_t:CDS:10 [Racocetra persica]
MVGVVPLHPLTSTILPSLFSPSATYHSAQPNIFNCAASVPTKEQDVDRISIGMETSQHDMRKEKNGHDCSTVQGRVADAKVDLLNSLHPILLSLWLDTAPSVFGTISSLTRVTPALQIVYLDIMDKQWIENNLKPLLKHFVIYFPFGAESADVCDLKVEPIIQEMNIMFCELVILFLTAAKSSMEIVMNKKGISNNTETGLFKKQKKPSKSETHELHSLWTEQIAEYVMGILGSDSIEDNNRLLRVRFKPENLKNLIPTLWGLLNYSNKELQESIFQTILDYSKRCRTQSTTKRICIEFISKILMVQSFSNYKDSFCMQKESSLVKSLQSWVLMLPKLLYELKTDSFETSQNILTVLCDIAKRGNKSIFGEEILEQLQVSLVPFFYTDSRNKEPLYGPFILLSQMHQRKTIEFLFYCPRIIDEMMLALKQVLKRDESIFIKSYIMCLSEKFSEVTSL